MAESETTLSSETEAAEIAGERQKIAVDFYNCLFHEVNVSYENGKSELHRVQCAE